MSWLQGSLYTRRHRSEPPFEIPLQVFRILKPDLEAKSGAARRPVRCGARLGAVERNEEALISAPGKTHSENPECMQKAIHCRLRHLFQDDREEARRPPEIPLPQVVARVTGQGRVKHTLDF